MRSRVPHVKPSEAFAIAVVVVLFAILVAVLAGASPVQVIVFIIGVLAALAHFCQLVGPPIAPYGLPVAGAVLLIPTILKRRARVRR